MARTSVLVIDGTGRGHAICDLFVRTDPNVQVYYGPGCTMVEHERIRVIQEISLTNCATALRFLSMHPVEFVFVSNIDALAAGYVDRLRSQGHHVIGPGEAASRLEASKLRGKRFCEDHGVPTIEYRAFTSPIRAKKYVRQVPFACVVKTDGLTRNGDGSVVCQGNDDAELAIEIFARKDQFPIVVERRLVGVEISLFALLDGATYLIFPFAFDYKRALEGDSGVNCDGMGSVAPHPMENAAIRTEIRAKIFSPLVAGLRAEHLRYTGFIYVGAMLTESGPRVLEINTRFGDSEAQVVLPGVHSSFTELCRAVLTRELGSHRLVTDNLSRCSVALVQGCLDPLNADATPGWPFGRFSDRQPVRGLESIGSKHTVAFYANLCRDSSGRPITCGGRVLHVVGSGQRLAEARARAYNAVAQVSFRGMRFRADIGADLS